MRTATLKQETRDTVRERVFVDLPQSDKRQNLWDKYIQNSPQDIDLSDEEIMEEVRAVRYGKV